MFLRQSPKSPSYYFKSATANNSEGVFLSTTSVAPTLGLTRMRNHWLTPSRGDNDCRPTVNSTRSPGLRSGPLPLSHVAVQPCVAVASETFARFQAWWESMYWIPNSAAASETAWPVGEALDSWNVIDSTNWLGVVVLCAITDPLIVMETPGADTPGPRGNAPSIANATTSACRAGKLSILVWVRVSSRNPKWTSPRTFVDP